MEYIHSYACIKADICDSLFSIQTPSKNRKIRKRKPAIRKKTSRNGVRRVSNHKILFRLDIDSVFYALDTRNIFLLLRNQKRNEIQRMEKSLQEERSAREKGLEKYV